MEAAPSSGGNRLDHRAGPLAHRHGENSRISFAGMRRRWRSGLFVPAGFPHFPESRIPAKRGLAGLADGQNDWSASIMILVSSK